MPPKKDAVAVPVLDTHPYGAFVNISVENAVLQLVSGTISAQSRMHGCCMC